MKYEIQYRSRRKLDTSYPIEPWKSYKEDKDVVLMGNNHQVKIRSENLSELQESLNFIHTRLSMGMVDTRIVQVMDERIFEPS